MRCFFVNLTQNGSIGAPELRAAAARQQSAATSYYQSVTEIPQRTVDELADALATGACLVDVREIAEYAEGHAPGAILIPLSQVSESLDQLASDSPIWVICRSGGRSQRACEYLVQHGYEAINVTGGTLAWIESHRDLVAGMERG